MADKLVQRSNATYANPLDGQQQLLYVINRKSSVGDLENLMDDEPDTLALATEVVIAWLANPNTKVAVEEVARFLSAIHSALASLSAVSPALDEPAETQFEPAVAVRKSLSIVGRIISMIDGKPYRLASIG